MALFGTPEVSWALLQSVFVDIGAIFSDFCLSSAIYCMGQNINHLQHVSVCVCLPDSPNPVSPKPDSSKLGLGVRVYG